VRKAQSLGHDCDHVAEQGLAERRMLSLDRFIGLGIQFIEDARDLRLNGCAARPLRDQAHFADRRVRPEAAHAYRLSVAEVDDDADATLEDEMHRGSGVALASDDLTGLNLEPATISGEGVGEFRT